MSQHEHSPSQPNQPQQSPAQDGIQPEPLRDLALSELQDTRLSPGKAKRVWRKIRALLSEEQIREAAREYYARRGRLPTRHSREKLSTYPATSWSAVYNAGSVGSRGLTKGRTLSKILAPLREKKQLLSESSIIEAAREYYASVGKLPTASSRERLSTYPDTNWGSVNSAGWVGSRGLTKGRTLSKILAPLREEIGNSLKRRKNGPYKQLLSESSIIEAAREYYASVGKLPTASSRERLSTYPEASWKSVNDAGYLGYRGLTKGRTLSTILAPLREEIGSNPKRRKNGPYKELLSESSIIEAAREYYARRGKLPTADSREQLSTYPETTWNTVYAAGRRGHRGLTKGRTLSKILAPLREEIGNNLKGRENGPYKQLLSESSIIEAAREYYSRRGKLPTASSREKLSTYPATNWGSVNSAGRVGSRGLTSGRTLSTILAPLREEIGNKPKRRTSAPYKQLLSESSIIEAAREYYARNGKMPTQFSRERLSTYPDTNWGSVNSAGRVGSRGLTSGRTLSTILAPLREEIGNKPKRRTSAPYKQLLSESSIIEAAREYYARNGKMPTQSSREELSTYPATSWSTVHAAGSVGCRGLTKGRTLSKILAPLRYELEPPGSPKLSPLSEISIIEAAREYHSRRGKLPTASSRERLSTYPATNWAAVNSAGWVGSRGLPKGRTLSKILAPLRDELANATECA